MEMITTGDPITAERAHHFGLVNELAEDGEAFEGALRLAERVTANAPVVRYPSPPAPQSPSPSPLSIACLVREDGASLSGGDARGGCGA